jgi:hypothetical protein
MPVGYWLAFHQALGARGMWMGLLAGLSTAALLLLLRFLRASGASGVGREARGEGMRGEQSRTHCGRLPLATNDEASCE